MLIDALLSANKHMNFAEYIHDPKKFLHLTDYLRTQIESSQEPELAEARAIFHRITTRKLYKMVDFKAFPWSLIKVCEDHFTPERIVEAAKALPASARVSSQDDPEEAEQIDPADIAALEPRHVIVDMAKMHYGMKDKNPLDSVRFYSKHHPDRCAQADHSDISLLMPPTFGEALLRVYTRDTRFYGLVQAGYRELLKTIPDPQRPAPDSQATEDPDPFADEPEVLLMGPSLTPPTTEEPSTPPRKQRSFSRVKSAPGVFGPREKTPFTNNTFMQVPKNYKPVSPTGELRGAKRAGSVTGKRKERESGDESPSASARKAVRKS